MERKVNNALNFVPKHVVLLAMQKRFLYVDGYEHARYRNKATRKVKEQAKSKEK